LESISGEKYENLDESFSIKRTKSLVSFIKNRANICKSVNKKIRKIPETSPNNSFMLPETNKTLCENNELKDFLEAKFIEKRKSINSIEKSFDNKNFEIKFKNEIEKIPEIQCKIISPKVSNSSKSMPKSALKNMPKITKNSTPKNNVKLINVMKDNEKLVKMPENITPRPLIEIPKPQPKPMNLIGSGIKDKENLDAENLTKVHQKMHSKPKSRCKNCLYLLSKGLSTCDCKCKIKGKNIVPNLNK